MGDGYQVQIGEVRRASDAAATAGDTAGAVDVAAAIGPVGAAMRGSRTAQGVSKVVPFWEDQVTKWSSDARAHAARLATAADRYAANEDQAAADLRAGGGGMRAE